jgi:hypothetical protein
VVARYKNIPISSVEHTDDPKFEIK